MNTSISMDEEAEEVRSPSERYHDRRPDTIKNLIARLTIVLTLMSLITFTIYIYIYQDKKENPIDKEIRIEQNTILVMLHTVISLMTGNHTTYNTQF